MTGDIIQKEEVQIGEDETAGELWDRLSTLGSKMLVNTLDNIQNGKIVRTPQGENFTLAPKLDKELSKINWEEKGALEIKNLVRGLNPGMGAFSILDGKKIKFWKVDNIKFEDFIEKFPEFKEYQNRLKKIDSGTVVYSSDKDGLYIKTKDEVLSIIEIQGENAKKMSICDYLRGNRIIAGEKFE